MPRAAGNVLSPKSPSYRAFSPHLRGGFEPVPATRQTFDAVPLQSCCRTERGTSGRTERRYFRSSDAAARPRSPPTGPRNRALRAVTLAGPDCTFTAPCCFPDARDDPGQFRGRTADTMPPLRGCRWQLGWEPRRLSMHRGAPPLFHVSAGRVPALSDCAAGLLVQYFAAGWTLCCSRNHASDEPVLPDELPADIHPAVVRRIVMAQSLPAAGAALRFINT